MFVSSAKITNSLWLAELTMSLMYKRKSRGPSTDPCGTPKRIHNVIKLSYLFTRAQIVLNQFKAVTSDSIILK